MAPPDFAKTKDYADGSPWTEAKMDAFVDDLVTWLNSTLKPALPADNQYGLVAATTSTANDSIKLTSKSGTALSTTSTSIDFVLPDASTSGKETKYSLTSDITLKLSGAHWGIGTTGNLTGAIIRFGLINDGQSVPALCAMYLGNRTAVASTLCFNTAISVTAPEHVLVSRTLNVGTWPVKEIGFAYVDFNDTGDIWAIESGIGKIFCDRSADGRFQPYNPIWAGFSVDPSVNVADFTQIGEQIIVKVSRSSAGTSNATTLTVTLPIKANSATDDSINNSFVIDNGIGLTSPGRVRTRLASSILDCFKDIQSTGWTAANGKNMNVFLKYHAYYG